MKLLIVDDEKLTRDGLLHSIDWNKIGITDIIQADDGINGLTMAVQHKPEIILSDVRMPRANGIEMANRIREVLPDTSIIFMSGYSDKEYLKAAIRLKAISYVEKPISPEEVEEVVSEAVSHVMAAVRTHHSHELFIQNETNKLALDLIYPNQPDHSSYIEKFRQINRSINNSTIFTTFIIKSILPLSEISTEDLNTFYESADTYIKSQNMNIIFTNKQDTYIILHVFSNEKPHEKKLFNIGRAFCDYLVPYTRLFVGIGKSVTGAEKIFDSYNSAVILLQNSFFYDYNSILQFNEESPVINPNLERKVEQFKDAITHKEKDSTMELTEEIYQSLRKNRSILVSIVKNNYYKLFTIVLETASQMHVNLSPGAEYFDTILDEIAKCSTLFDLHNMFLETVILFFDSLEKDNQTENSTIFLIKEYISKNYKNEHLSVKDISEHVFLSFSYVCTVFKAETGKTLNQYITEFRVDKAKKLLLDPRYKITDIASKVGYSDSNYFGKLFKKMVGLSPSEFRENNSK